MNKHLFLFISFICFPVFSQEINFNALTLNKENYFEEIDYTILHDKILIPVEINNKIYNFLLDTGAPNLISKKILKELNLSNIKKIEVDDANGKKDSLQIVNVSSIKMGSLIFENSVALVSDIENHPLLKCYTIDGFIGSNLLQKSILKIDTKEKKIILTDQIKKLDLKSKPLKIKLLGFQKAPYVELKIKGKNNTTVAEDALIDTGMGGFYEMSNRVYTVFTKYDVVEVLSKSIGSSGMGLFGNAETKEQVLFQLNALTKNQTVFNNLISTTTDDTNSRIGVDILKYGDIIIDFRAKKFYFEAEKNVILNEKPPKYSATILNNKYAIGFVWDVDLKEKIKFGDEIIRIDNSIIKQLNLCDILKLKNYKEENVSYELEIKNADNKNFVLKIN
jgi:predicted aspartyl protease